MYFVYDENEPKGRRGGGGVVRYYDLNANKHYLTHYSNAKYLTFLAQNETGFQERNQAQKELSTAERKMAFWRKHPNFNLQTLNAEIERIDKQWQAKPQAKRTT